MSSCPQEGRASVSMHLGRREIQARNSKAKDPSDDFARTAVRVSDSARESVIRHLTITHRSTRRPAEIRARSRRATSASGKYLAPDPVHLFSRARCVASHPLLLLLHLLLSSMTAKKEVKQIREGWREGERRGRIGRGRPRDTRRRGGGGVAAVGYRKLSAPTTNAMAPLSFYNRKAHISQPVSPHA